MSNSSFDINIFDLIIYNNIIGYIINKDDKDIYVQYLTKKDKEEIYFARAVGISNATTHLGIWNKNQIMFNKKILLTAIKNNIYKYFPGKVSPLFPKQLKE